ncbi:Cupin [Microdochium nivale]|nr:Cupin [Microdochium nivale]
MATTTTTTVEPVVYHIPATKLIPNSTQPLLYYPGFFLHSAASTTAAATADNNHKKQQQQEAVIDATAVFDLFRQHGWETQWVAKYGLSQPSHYHPETHECMAVLTGPGRIRFGVADLDPDWRRNTPLAAAAATAAATTLPLEARSSSGSGSKQGEGVFFEAGGVELTVHAGDAFVIPAGVAHKSYDVEPGAAQDATALTGSDFHGVDGAGDSREVVQACKLSGFTMIGAYPGGLNWTWAEGGAHVGDFERIWGIEKPALDPLTGRQGGINELWA